jgi:hypothetical protein
VQDLGLSVSCEHLTVHAPGRSPSQVGTKMSECWLSFNTYLFRVSAIEQVYLCDHLSTTLGDLLQQTMSQFLQQYYSHVLGLQVLVNTFAIQPAIMVRKMFVCSLFKNSVCSTRRLIRKKWRIRFCTVLDVF